MNKSLVVYNNLQYNPIEIKDFCVVEVYKGTIEKSNAIGYFIQPIVDNIKETIEQRVRQSAVEGYENLVILAGREHESYNRRIIYAVWYNGTEVPTYPAKPDIIDLGIPSPVFDYFETIELENDGAPTDCRVTLTLSSLDKSVEFYINDDYFKIDMSNEVPAETQELVIDNTGVFYNGKNVLTFSFLSTPKLKAGVNVIRASKLMIEKIKIDYIRKF